MNVGVFYIFPEVSEIVFISFHSFFFSLSVSFISTILSSTLLILSSASVILLLVPSRVCFIHLLHYSGKGNVTPLQYSCLENPMDRGAWMAAVHVVAESWTQLSDFTFTLHFHALEKEMATLSSVLA